MPNTPARPAGQEVSILLADDHELVREALRELLDRQDDIAVVGTCGDADAALKLAKDLEPDIIVFDIDMPGRTCFEAAREAQTYLPSTRIVFLSAFFHDSYIEDALAVNASAYLTKGEPPPVLLDAIRTVARGGTFFSDQVAERLVKDNAPGEGRTRSLTLTRRELETLRYVARGLAKKEIAGTMHVSVRTVDTHVRNIMDKLGLHDRVELTRFAIREGIAEP